MEQLRERIKALMSENEAVKNNAMKIISTAMATGIEQATKMWSNAKRENIAYQNVLDEMDGIVAGRVAQEIKGVQS